ncbi:MAG: hypothetical protein UX08_C0002G0051 [Candidatus Collierbacteria bacterium GW2011_GWB1_45_35]|uniref:Uncharacterized protein n=2 Tax=Candidatus Collieribacteriota TaxID=1752725 RepID=A0A837IEW6_9BACT|nr:MAG: hypothetical protein UW48_C0004G0062 [Microgenomates group bacterium GW2011_GWC1_44_23]KKT95738.1 MAG: hypothetical protein UW96_C0005G0062 [Candidatus Collierbacteria bacterium GW2011_GWA1_45_15]KKU00385.1 MAG: hypothetical protein UX01_C0005G0062 [Candidatus Collierbacteria bacterium GW2011_GWB2_45_17]KKU05836.1 MAG: hypothetical protein UX08_C0002G0051 [Candidatus Collierbacteria bacterium GW2011_GWB1_45_35]KKU07454.1 MAG: hypothetical protein UX11_C0015G0009 [Candidatus Collierbacte
MTEPDETSRKAEKQTRLKIEQYITLAEKLSLYLEPIPFSGIDEESLVRLRFTDSQYPGFSTPIDKIITRMEQEGIKITFGTHPGSGNVYVLPYLSNDIENDSISPRHLKLSVDMDEVLKSLILANKASQKVP